MGTVTMMTRSYPDFPVSALRHMTGMTVHAVDLEAKDGPAMVSGTLARIARTRCADLLYLVLIADDCEEWATVREADRVTVAETVRLCDEHGVDRCDCA